MGGISDDQVEWAVVHRLKAMLDDPPKTEFNVTQTFAHFTAILIWTSQRIRAPRVLGAANHWARRALQNLRGQAIYDPPWSLSRQPPLLDNAGILDADDVNAGEQALWARALTRADARALCGPDRASLRFGLRLGFRDRLVALERLLSDAGHKSAKLKPAYTSNWLAKTLAGLAALKGNRMP
jgi:hypothetical protein